MKTRNRMLAAILAVVLAFGLTACGGGGKEEDAESVYKTAMEKMNSLESMAAGMDITVKMSDGSESMDITMDAEMKIQDIKKESMTMSMDMNVGMSGITMAIQAYYADGWYMIDTMGQKMKYQMPLEEAAGQASMGQGMDLSALGKVTMEEKDGQKTLSYEADIAKMKENATAEEYLSFLDSLGLGELAETGLNYQTVEGTMTVNGDGYATSNTIHIVASIEEDGQSLEMDINVAVTYENPGQDVTVDIPDASEYTEIDPSMLG